MFQHLVFDGVADGPLGVGLEIVSTAARLARAGRVAVPSPKQRVVSLDGAPVRSSAGRRVTVDGALRARAGDVIVLPGLGAATPSQLSALLARPDIRKAIARLPRLADRAVVAASCSATFVLAASGVLEGREATTTWWLGAAFRERFPEVTLRPDRMVVRAGEVFTAGSALAHADLLLALLTHLHGATLAHLVARYLVLDERPSQARYMVLEHLRSADPVVQKLEGFLTKHLTRQVTLEEMAAATLTSPRTLARRLEAALGTTPQRFAQRLRVARAQHLLETTRHSVEEVAARVGYADPAAFRRLYLRTTGARARARR